MSCDCAAIYDDHIVKIDYYIPNTEVNFVTYVWKHKFVINKLL